MTTLREAAKQVMEEWYTDPGSVRMASLMILLQNILFEEQQREINAKELKE